MLALATALLSWPCHADDADTAYEEGKRLLQASQWEAACKQFEKSEELGGATVRTRYMLGRCNDGLGRPAKAYRAFSDAARLGGAEGDTERASVARKRAAELESKVVILKIFVSPAASEIEGLALTLDDEPLSKQSWNDAVAVDPGDHVVSASAPGHQSVRRDISGTKPGTTAEVTIPPLAAGEDPATGADDGGGLSGSARDREPDGDDGDDTEMNNRALFWTGLGLTITGGLALAVGGAFFAADGEATRRAIGAMAGGGVLLAVGIPFLVVGGKQVPKEQAWRLQPWVSPLGAGLTVRF